MSILQAIDRYMARAFLSAFAVILGVIVVLLQTLDLMNSADEVLGHDASGLGEIARYIALRAPQLADRFIPFVALLAALLTMARLSQSSEITALRASGMAPLRILAPVCVAGGVIALAHFAFHETIVVDANENLARWQDRDYAPGPAPEDDRIDNIRMVVGGQVVRADAMTPSETPAGDGWRLERLRVYELGAGGVSEALRAPSAVHDGAGWTLTDAQRFDAGSLQWRPAGAGAWIEGPEPGRLTAAALDPDRLGIAALGQAVRGAADSRDGAPRLETALLYRFSAPLASIIMPLLAAVAGFGLHRSKSLLARVAAGLALGFSYFVFDNVMVVLGRLDTTPAVVAAFAAPLCFLSIGLGMRR